MFKKIKNFICKLFNIKACQCDDEQVEVLNVEVLNKEEEKPTHCGSHSRFRKTCPACIATQA